MSQSRLTPELVRRVFKLRHEGLSLGVIADRVGLSPRAIGRVLKGQQPVQPLAHPATMRT